MASIGTRWAGRDLSPLPYESALSVYWRFAWRNTLSPAQLRRIIGIPGYRPQYNWIARTSFFSDVLGWHPLSKNEQCLVDGSTKYPLYLFEPHLRYCPICLGGGYHSYWFQFSFLDYCPVHEVRLHARCHTCRYAVGFFNITKQLFSRPYFCVHCGEPISGVAPDLSLYLDFRDHHETISRTFSPLCAWFEKSQKLRWQLCSSMEKGYFQFGIVAPGISEWCDPTEFACAVVFNHFPLPSFCRQSKYKKLSICSWKLKLYEGPGYYLQRVSLGKAMKTPRSVYLCTIRLIKRTIERQFGCISDSEHQRYFDSWDDPTIDVREFSPQWLAFYIMRYKLEGNLVRTDDYRSIWLRQLPFNFEAIDFDGRTTRLSWRLMYLATFVGWYNVVLAARRTGKLDACRFRGDDSRLRFVSISIDSENVLRGICATLPFDGLSILSRSNLKA